MAKKKADKVAFSDVVEGDKLTIKWDVEITKIEDLDEYLRPADGRKVHKVSCKIKNGPFKDREGTFIILGEDHVNLHARPTWQQKWWDYIFGTKKKKVKKPAK